MGWRSLTRPRRARERVDGLRRRLRRGGEPVERLDAVLQVLGLDPAAARALLYGREGGAARVVGVGPLLDRRRAELGVDALVDHEPVALRTDIVLAVDPLLGAVAAGAQRGRGDGDPA